MLKKYTLFVALLLSMLLFTGCGEKEELTIFEENMKNFYTEVSNIENAIAAISSIFINKVSTAFSLLASISAIAFSILETSV